MLWCCLAERVPLKGIHMSLSSNLKLEWQSIIAIVDHGSRARWLRHLQSSSVALHDCSGYAPRHHPILEKAPPGARLVDFLALVARVELSS